MPMDNQSLHTRHRPADWDAVLGQDAVVNSLAPLIESRSQHCFVLVGPSGCGKTTLARIAAAKLGALPTDIREVNAAKYTGKDDMVDLTENIRLVPLEGRPVIFILDECHQLSKSAWNSLLKDTEEPPDWVYWFFCTTEPGKIPQAIITRSVSYTLAPVDWEVLLMLLQCVAEVEGIECGDEILGMIARAAEGSPRQALTFLAACANTTSLDEARQLCQQVAEDENADAFKLAQLLMKGGSWKDFQPLLNALKEQNPEGVRRVVIKYATTTALSAGSDKAAMRAASILDMFAVPFNSNEGATPLVTSCARLVLL